MKRFAVLMLTLTFVVVAGDSQSRQYLSTFFKQNIGLNNSEIASIEKGQAVAKLLDSPTASQMLLFGAVSINAQPDA